MGLALVGSFTSGQRIQWLGHAMRRNVEEMVRAVLELKPTEKDLAGDLERNGLIQ